MIVGVVQKDSIKGLISEVESANTKLYDVLELRLDSCEDFSPSKLISLKSPLPVLFTLRSKQQGGFYKGSESQRLEDLKKLAKLNPNYMDLESDLSSKDIEEIMSLSPNTKFIISCHDFAKTPENIEQIFEDMQKKASGCIYKIASYAKNTKDSLRMLKFCQEKTKKNIPVIGICMGEYGAATRILAPVVHTGFCYCPINSPSAPGQILAKELCEVYNFKSLNKKTNIYALLGDPVIQSIGNIYHNAENKKFNENAVYIKLQINKSEFSETIDLLKELEFKGLSVTMPLKEVMMDFIDVKSKDLTEIGAVNTIHLQKNTWYGYNTDGEGTCEALNTNLLNKTVVVLGAGGAAKAIINELSKYTKNIIVLNRTTTKTLSHGKMLSLKELSNANNLQYDVIINTLPASVELPITNNTFISNCIAMDISYGKDSQFLLAAATHNCICLDGKSLFTAQAKRQRSIWGLAYSTSC